MSLSAGFTVSCFVCLWPIIESFMRCILCNELWYMYCPSRLTWSEWRWVEVRWEVNLDGKTWDSVVIWVQSVNNIKCLLLLASHHRKDNSQHLDILHLPCASSPGVKRGSPPTRVRRGGECSSDPAHPRDLNRAVPNIRFGVEKLGRRFLFVFGRIAAA